MYGMDHIVFPLIQDHIIFSIVIIILLLASSALIRKKVELPSIALHPSSINAGVRESNWFMDENTPVLDQEQYRRTILPVADAALLLEKAKEFATLVGKKLDGAVVRQAAELMWDTYQFDSATTVSDAEELLFLEQHPEAVVFENSATKFIAKGGNEYWQSIKQVGKETMLGDFRDFIDTLIKKHGAHAKFYVESDQGGEYFILQPKRGQ